MYTVRFTPTALKEFASLPADVQVRIDAAVVRLSHAPRAPGVSKLKNMDGYRIRVGDYRILYEIRDAILLVLVFRVGHRSKVYR